MGQTTSLHHGMQKGGACHHVIEIVDFDREAVHGMDAANTTNSCITMFGLLFG